MSKSSELQVINFGCRLNAYESEVIGSHAKNAGLDDTIIFNTCAVTKEAERQSKQAIRKAVRENPGAKVIVTGCASQIDPKAYASIEGVSNVIGNDLKLKPEVWSNLGADLIQVNDIMDVKEAKGYVVDGFEGRARAYVQIQQGCDHRCTFCIIPYGRGNSRSVAIEEIAAQISELTHRGYNEVVLTGVDMTSYGQDLPGKPNLGQMLRRVFALVPELPRLRLSSLDPAFIDKDLWILIENEPRLMPHLHLSIQAGDNMILKRMKRRHLREDVIELCGRARNLRPDIVFGADIIAGFPTETEEMFENTLDLVESCELTFLHVFPYSERPDTPAAKMPSVPKEVRKERAGRLRQLGQRQLDSYLLSRIKKQEQVIVEKENIGRSEAFAQVRLDQDVAPGKIVSVINTGVDGNYLLGEVQHI